MGSGWRGKIERGYYLLTQALAIENTISDDAASVFLRGTSGSALKSYTVGNLGLSYYRLKQTDKGIGLGEQALALMRKTANRVGEGKVLSWLGWGYFHAGQNDKALSTLSQSLAVNHETGNVGSEAFTLSTLMDVWNDQKKPRLAIFYGKQAVNKYQELRGNSKRLDKDLQKSLLQSHEDTYRKLADTLIGEGRLPEAQQVLGLLKQEELFSFVRRSATVTSSTESRADLTSDETEQDKQYRAIADRVTQIGARRGELLAKTTRTADEEKELSGLENQLDIANRNFQKFVDSLSSQLDNTPQKGRVEQITDAQSLQNTLHDLGDGTIALYTLVADDKYRVILVTPDAEKAAEYSISATDLNRKVLDFRQALQNSSVDPRPLAQELYTILIAPIAKDLDGAKAKTLMWSLDGTLRYLPMSALYDGKNYLVERYRSDVFTPASNANLKDLPSPQWKALGLGVSKAQPGFEALPGVADELNGIIKGGSDIKGILPGKVEIDSAFTADTMKTALRQRYPLIHIASHFAFRPGNETDSFLLLGDGSHFDIDQIKNLSFRDVDLLTLSACDTASSGTNADGREVESFGVLAQRQGAKSVLASLWPVSDSSTQLLMQNFYRLREAQNSSGTNGISKAEVLRQAQLLLLYGDASSTSATTRGMRIERSGASSALPAFVADPKAPFAHPYYWAPFILIGNWR